MINLCGSLEQLINPLAEENCPLSDRSERTTNVGILDFHTLESLNYRENNLELGDLAEPTEI